MRKSRVQNNVAVLFLICRCFLKGMCIKRRKAIKISSYYVILLCTSNILYLYCMSLPLSGLREHLLKQDIKSPRARGKERALWSKRKDEPQNGRWHSPHTTKESLFPMHVKTPPHQLKTIQWKNEPMIWTETSQRNPNSQSSILTGA